MSKHHPSMLARSAEAVVAGDGAAERSAAKARLIDPDAAIDEILSLLGEERFREARRLAAAAIDRFPDNARVRGAWGIFDNRDKAKPSLVGPQPSTDEEFEWLRNPPEWARGKWVALVGPEAVAAADTLDDLMAGLDSRSFPKDPLAVRIDEA